MRGVYASIVLVASLVLGSHCVGKDPEKRSIFRFYAAWSVQDADGCRPYFGHGGTGYSAAKKKFDQVVPTKSLLHLRSVSSRKNAHEVSATYLTYSQEGHVTGIVAIRERFRMNTDLRVESYSVTDRTKQYVSKRKQGIAACLEDLGKVESDKEKAQLRVRMLWLRYEIADFEGLSSGIRGLLNSNMAASSPKLLDQLHLLATDSGKKVRAPEEKVGFGRLVSAIQTLRKGI